MQQRDRETGEALLAAEAAVLEGRRPLEWFAASGRGTVYSYVVGHEPFLPAFKHLLPHIMVVVELEEGARIVGLHGRLPRRRRWRFGMQVRVAFKRLTERVTLPVWELDR